MLIALLSKHWLIFIFLKVLNRPHTVEEIIVSRHLFFSSVFFLNGCKSSRTMCRNKTAWSALFDLFNVSPIGPPPVALSHRRPGENKFWVCGEIYPKTGFYWNFNEPISFEYGANRSNKCVILTLGVCWAAVEVLGLPCTRCTSGAAAALSFLMTGKWVWLDLYGGKLLAAS